MIATVPFDPARSRRLARIGTIIAIALVVLVVSFPLLSGLMAPLVPQSVQEPIGEKVIETASAGSKFCEDPEGVAALEKLVVRLADAAGSKRSYKVYIADGDVLNAFAAPGGHIVLFRPIIDHAESPDEVAGVLAHEMGHVVENHPAKGLVEALGFGIYGLLIPGGGDDSAVIARTLMSNHYSRKDELAADRVGVQMLNEAGVDSRGLIAFFEHMKAQGGEIPGALEFLSTHPSGDTRAAKLQDIVKAGPPALDDAQWQALRNICKTTAEKPTPIVVGR